jgi:hypothetical protein
MVLAHAPRMEAVLRVTLDTNVIDHRERIEAACPGLDVELTFTTVTDRETEGTSRATSGASVIETGVYGESRYGKALYAPVRESFVLGESRLGEGALGADDSPLMMESILAVISAGSFPRPGMRDSLGKGQRRQLRDAMILEAHTREGRDVLVTEDAKGFIRGGRREQLEALCRTRIMTVDEFCDVAVNGRQITNAFAVFQPAK